MAGAVGTAGTILRVVQQGNVFPYHILAEIRYCMEFGQSVLGNIIKTVATRCQIFRLNASNRISPGLLTVLLQTINDRLRSWIYFCSERGMKGIGCDGKGRERRKGREKWR